MKTISLSNAFTLATCISLVSAATGSADDLVPLKLRLPAPAFIGTPKDVPAGSNIEPPSTKPKPPLMVPSDVKNIAPQAKISCSDSNTQARALAKIIDGDKEALDESMVLVRKGIQHVQFDLGTSRELYAIAIWHAHDTAKIYRDVIVQVADNSECTENVRTLFNNDITDECGRGAGKDKQYFETFEGKVVDAKGEKARFVRLYSKGSSESALNEYIEVEIYARPAK